MIIVKRIKGIMRNIRGYYFYFYEKRKKSLSLKRKYLQKKVGSFFSSYVLFLETNVRANIIRFYWLNFASCGDLYLFIKYIFYSFVFFLRLYSSSLTFLFLRFGGYTWRISLALFRCLFTLFLEFSSVPLLFNWREQKMFYISQ